MPMNLMNKDKIVYHVTAKETMRQEALKQTGKEQQEIKG